VQANLERDLAQLENARTQERRYRILLQQELIAREQYDQIRTNMTALEATVQADRAAFENAKAAIAAGRDRPPSSSWGRITRRRPARCGWDLASAPGGSSRTVSSPGLLIGLAAKNAILIVEFAKVRREQGLDLREAARQAARIRFRPILMTSFAFILGSLPMVVATGAGAASRHSIGTTVVGGMLAVTVLGVLLVPAFYVAVERLKEWRRPVTS
jgi:hypothetical protein